MYILIYFGCAFVLMRCAVDSRYRRETITRWKTTRMSRVIGEIGLGLLGILIFSCIVYFAVRWISEPKPTVPVTAQKFGV
jgi:hypothetical protein